ncbi:hypothetical protein JB92DRAFT_3273742 [Gautieria morchelliformis]|nr:hypothetical protein JB92DRAFT_3273742 [Gautieria morchelliformis]
MPFTVGQYLKVAKGMRKYAKWLFKDIYLVAPIIPRLNVDGVKRVREWGSAVKRAVSPVGSYGGYGSFYGERPFPYAFYPVYIEPGYCWGDESLEAPPDRRPAKRESLFAGRLSGGASRGKTRMGMGVRRKRTRIPRSGSTWNTDPPPREDEEALSMLFEVEAMPNEGPFEPLLLEDDELEPGLLPPELPPRPRRRHLVGGSWGI